MLLEEIINSIEINRIIGEKSNIEIKGISYHSESVKKGDIFFALPGTKTHGKYYIKEAVEKGAAAVVVPADAYEDELTKYNVPIVVVNNIRKVLREISERIFPYPRDKMKIIGVTGTNGKTTITYLMESILLAAGHVPGVIGTIEVRWKENILPSSMTTPEICDLQYLLHRMFMDGVDTVAMEVSSHALSQERVDNVQFDIAIFTNLTRDHLDYHKTMEEYFKAKLRLFELLKISNKPNKIAIINVDNEYGKIMVEMLKSYGGIEVVTYGIGGGDYRAEVKVVDVDGVEFDIIGPLGDKVRVSSRLIGLHNVYNITAAFIAAKGLNIAEKDILKGIKNLRGVPGRLEKVDVGQDFTVVVDYAHTDDALENVLNTLSRLPHNRLITVFGCGGDRDRGKRPIMGKKSVLLSDYVVITSDNPRTEPAGKIVEDILAGVRETGKDNWKVIIDRREAINYAISIAESGDIVLIAGKGHENYQIIGTARILFDDRAVAREILTKRMKYEKIGIKNNNVWNR
jgi:UDP-N-acetylmuramoyl-L-alanyl-D-glutamate--2,6-diaminopimelate ligase